MNHQIKMYYSHRQELTLDDGLVLKGCRIIIPEEMRRQVLQSLHASHQGFAHTKLRASQVVFCPGINNDIRNICLTCPECQVYQPSQQLKPMMSDFRSGRPFPYTSADLFSYQGKDFMIYADRSSGWTCVTPFHTPKRFRAS
jgi:hypothetical protein